MSAGEPGAASSAVQAAPSAPALSVVLCTPDHYTTVRRTVRFLRAQTAREDIELILVAPAVADLGLEAEEVEGFHACQVVEVGAVTSVAAAYAAGVRRARAPVVALAEDHSFPEPDWARALIARHREPWAAVGPVMGNANPGSLVSWCDFLISYGPWADPQPGQESLHLPGHNSSYKRSALMSYGGRLEGMLAAETVLHADLRGRGHRLYLDPAAKTAHVNFSRLFPWLRVQVHAGRVFAAARSGDWTPLRRLLFTCGSPLIPFVRARRAVGQARRTEGARALVHRLTPLLLLGLALDGLGQMLGYAFGAGRSTARMSAFEFHRTRYLTESDRRRMADP